jgi:hypothetical protein
VPQTAQIDLINSKSGFLRADIAIDRSQIRSAGIASKVGLRETPNVDPPKGMRCRSDRMDDGGSGDNQRMTWIIGVTVQPRDDAPHQSEKRLASMRHRRVGWQSTCANILGEICRNVFGRVG